MRTAAYARYSTDLQREASIRDQLRNIEGYCERAGWPVPALYRDQGVSGSRSDRAGYLAMLAAARDKAFDVLLVDDFSRLSRDHIEAAQTVRLLKFLGIRLIGVSDGLDTARSGAKLEAGFRGLMAELYLDDLAEKTHRGLMGQALDGYSAGGLPYGFDTTHDGKGHRRVINEAEAEWVRWIFAQYVAGLSPRAIAVRLNELGVPSPRGGKWAVSALYPDAKHVGVLGNPLYHGQQVWNRSKWVKDPATGRRRRTLRPRAEWVITEHPELKIIDDATWEAAQARARATRARTAGQREKLQRACSGGRGPRYLFSGLLKCGACGGAYVIVDRYRYGCAAHKDRGAAACANSLKIAREKVEQILLAGIKDGLLSEDAFRVFEEEARRLLKDSQPDPGAARREIARAQAEADNIMAAIRQGIITPTTKKALEEAETRLLSAQAHLREVQAWTPAQILPRAREIHRSLVDQLEKVEDVAAAREALRAIVGEIRLIPEDGELWAEMKNGAVGAISQITVVAGTRFGRYSTEPLRVKLYSKPRIAKRRA